MTFKQELKEIGKTLATILVSVTLVGGCAKACSKPSPTEYADATPIISQQPKLPYLTHRAFDEFRLIVTENQESKRLITFCDYGFDGKLDSMLIQQEKRKEATVTNSTELTKWQPIFEELRYRRFGSYTNSYEYKTLQR